MTLKETSNILANLTTSSPVLGILLYRENLGPGRLRKFQIKDHSGINFLTISVTLTNNTSCDF